MLYQWIKIKGDGATYHNLMQAFRDDDDKDMVDYIHGLIVECKTYTVGKWLVIEGDINVVIVRLIGSVHSFKHCHWYLV